MLWINYKSVIFITIVNLLFSQKAPCIERGGYGLFLALFQCHKELLWEYAGLREEKSPLHSRVSTADNHSFISLPLSPVDGSSSSWPITDKGANGAEGGLASAGTGGNPGGSPSGGGGDGQGGGGGADHPSYSGEGIDFSEDRLNVLFTRLDQLMKQIDGEVILLVDLDGTLFDSSVYESQREMRVRFKAFVEKWRLIGKLRVVIVTRRKMDSFRFLTENGLPEPDFLISMHGSIQPFRIVESSPREKVSGLMNGIHDIENEEARYECGDDYLMLYSWCGFIITYFTQERLEDALNRQGLSFHSVRGSVVDPLHTITINLDERFNFDDALNLQRLDTVARDVGGFLVRYEVARANNTCTFSIKDSKQHVVSQLAGAMGLNVDSQQTIEEERKKVRVIAGGDTEDDIDMMAGSESYHVEERIYVRSAQNNFDRNLIPAGSQGVVLTSFLSQLVEVLERMINRQNQASGGQ